MSPLVRFDHLPAEMTDGERAAIAAADRNGWISPPLYDSLAPEPERPWRTAHLRYLERRRLIAERRYRLDGQFRFRLNADGMAIKAGLPVRLEPAALTPALRAVRDEIDRMAA